MPIAAFLVPMIGTGTIADPRRGKYEPAQGADLALGIPRVGTLRFGRTEDGILMIEAPLAYLNTIDADPQCRVFATQANINDPLTAAQVSNLQTFLENRGIPAGWIAEGETRRQVIRGLAGMFLFSQRMEGNLGMSWKQLIQSHGVTLATEWQALPLEMQNQILDTAATYDWGGLDIRPTHTLRQILRFMGNRFQTQQIQIGGFLL